MLRSRIAAVALLIAICLVPCMPANAAEDPIVNASQSGDLAQCQCTDRRKIQRECSRQQHRDGTDARRSEWSRRSREDSDRCHADVNAKAGNGVTA